MCTVVEEYAKEKSLETARLLIAKNVDEDIILEATGITLEELAQLKN